MKRFFVLIVLLMSVGFLWGQISPIHETFSNLGPYGGYQLETWTGDDGGTWTATDARTDQTIDGKAICIRDGMLTSPTVSGGIGTLTVTTQRKFAGGSGNMDLRVNGVSVGSIPYDETVQITTIEDINIEGDIVVVIDATNSSSDRPAIDNLMWTAYGEVSLPPSISDIVQNPEEDITSTMTVSVSADVTEGDAAIDNVELHWGTSTGDYTEIINMIPDVGDTYVTEFDIPAQADDTTVYYVVYAEDVDGLSRTSPEQSYSIWDPKTTALPYEENFETDLGDCYTYSVSGPNYYWIRGEFGGIGYAQMSGYGSDMLEEDWLILPSIDMSDYDEVIMNFESTFQYGSPDELDDFKLLYSTDYAGIGDPSTATWHVLNFDKPTSASWDWIPSGDVELPDTEDVIWLGFQYYYDVDYPLWRITNISIEEVPEVLPVATPTFDPPAGIFYEEIAVDIDSATEDATIYYSFDSDTGPWTEFIAPLTINETTTIWAYAEKTDMEPSSVASATYTFPTGVSTIAELRNGNLGELYKLTGEAILTYQQSHRNKKYIQDGTAAIEIDDPGGNITTIYDIGDGITGIVGTLGEFNNLMQFTPETDPGAPTTVNNEIIPEVKTLADLSSDDQAKVVKINNVMFQDIGDFSTGTNYTITDPTDTGVFRTNFYEADYINTPIPQSPQNVTGIVLQYQTTMQLVSRWLDDFENNYEGIEVEVTSADVTDNVPFEIEINTSEIYDEWDFISYDFTLQFDADKIAYSSFNLDSSIASEAIVTVGDATPGEITVGGIGSIEGEGNLITLVFNPLDDGVTDLTLSEFVYNGDIDVTNLIHGNVTLSNILEPVATPTFSPEPGTYEDEVEVSILCDTPDAEIYYTTDLSEPDQNSELYVGPITITESTTFKARAYKEDMYASEVATATYSITIDIGELTDAEITVSDAYVIVPDQGDVFQVLVSTSELYSEWNVTAYQFELEFNPNLIEYVSRTTSGTIASHGGVSVNVTDPGVLSVGWIATSPLVGEGPIVKINFKAIDNGSGSLHLNEFKYNTEFITNLTHGSVHILGVEHQVATPTFDPAPGYYPDPQTVTINKTTEDALIYYTDDGSEPDENSTLYTDPIDITEDVTLKAKAFKPDWIASETATGVYYISDVPPVDATITAEDLETEVSEIFELEISTTELIENWGITAYDFILDFDDSMIEFVELETDNTMIQDNGIIESNLLQPGKLSIGWAGTETITGTGNILKIRFEALQSGNTSVQLSDFYYNDNLITDLVDGNIQIYDMLEDAIITVSEGSGYVDDIVEITMSTSKLLQKWDIFAYQFDMSYNENVVEFIGVEIDGTISENGDIAVNDLEPGVLSVGWYSAFPIHGAGDLVKFQFKVIMPGDSPLEVSDFIYDTTNITNINHGHITGLVELDTSVITASSADVYHLEDVTVDIQTSEMLPEWNVTAYEFDLEYDESILEYQGFSIENTVSEEGSAIVNADVPGLLQVGWYSVTALAGEGDLIKLHFKAVEVGHSPIDFVEFIYNTEPIQFLQDGYVNVSLKPMNIAVSSDGESNPPPAVTIDQIDQSVIIIGDYWALENFETPPQEARLIGLSLLFDEVLSGSDVLMSVDGAAPVTVTLGAEPDQLPNEMWYELDPYPGGTTVDLTFHVVVEDSSDYWEEITITFLDTEETNAPLFFTVDSDGETNAPPAVAIEQTEDMVSVTGDYWALENYGDDTQIPPVEERLIGLSIKILDMDNKTITVTVDGGTPEDITLGAEPGQDADEFWYYLNPDPSGNTVELTIEAEADAGADYYGELTIEFIDEEITEGPIYFDVASDGVTNHENVTIDYLDDVVTIVGDYWALENYDQSGETPPEEARWIGLSINLLGLDNETIYLTIDEGDPIEVTLGEYDGQDADEFWFYLNPYPGGRTIEIDYVAPNMPGADLVGSMTMTFDDEEITPAPIVFTVDTDDEYNAPPMVEIEQVEDIITITGDFWALSEYGTEEGFDEIGRWIGLSVILEDFYGWGDFDNKEITYTVDEADPITITLGQEPDQQENEMWYYFLAEEGGNQKVLNFTAEADAGADFDGQITIIFDDTEVTPNPVPIAYTAINDLGDPVVLEDNDEKHVIYEVSQAELDAAIAAIDNAVALGISHEEINAEITTVYQNWYGVLAPSPNVTADDVLMAEAIGAFDIIDKTDNAILAEDGFRVPLDTDISTAQYAYTQFDAFENSQYENLTGTIEGIEIDYNADGLFVPDYTRPGEFTCYIKLDSGADRLADAGRSRISREDNTWYKFVVSIDKMTDDIEARVKEIEVNNERVYYAVTDVTLDETEINLVIQSVDTAQLIATIVPDDATIPGVIWSSEDEDIATVDQTGLVTAVSKGTTTITVTTIDGEFTAECQVSVGIFYGDIVNDGLVRAYDALLALRYSAGLDPLPIVDPRPWVDWRFERADVDGDDEITAYDASLILQYSVGIINTFPIEGGRTGRRLAVNPEINVSVHDGYIVFESQQMETIYGLDITIPLTGNLTLGEVEFNEALQDYITAVNPTEESYKVSMATAEPIDNAEMILRIPYTIDEAEEVNINVKINANEFNYLLDLLPLDGEDDEIIPLVNAVSQNYPNPFNPDTKIELSVKETAQVKVQVYNMRGQLVRELLNETLESGIHQVTWNGRDRANRAVSSGMYFYRVVIGNEFTQTRKMMLLK